MKEALRYLNNAKEILRKAPVEDNTYTDIKPVREVKWRRERVKVHAIKEKEGESGKGFKY